MFADGLLERSSTNMNLAWETNLKSYDWQYFPLIMSKIDDLHFLNGKHFFVI